MGSKEIGIRKSEFVAKIQILRTEKLAKNNFFCENNEKMANRKKVKPRALHVMPI